MRSVFILALVGSLSCAAWAQAQEDHAAHHPAGASAPVAAKRTSTEPAKASAKKTFVSPDSKLAAEIDSRMKTMNEMHEKMMSAKTPAEREALMGEHMKSMQDGMSMMKKMKQDANDKPMDCEAMSKRLDMMESMMQMMMDREAARPDAK